MDKYQGEPIDPLLTVISGELAANTEIDALLNIANFVLERGCRTNVYMARMHYGSEKFIGFEQEIETDNNEYYDTVSVGFYNPNGVAFAKLVFGEDNTLLLPQSEVATGKSAKQARQLIDEVMSCHQFDTAEQAIMKWTRSLFLGDTYLNSNKPARLPYPMHDHISELLRSAKNPDVTGQTLERYAHFKDANNRLISIRNTSYSGNVDYFTDEDTDYADLPSWHITIGNPDNPGRGTTLTTFHGKKPEIVTFGYPELLIDLDQDHNKGNGIRKIDERVMTALLDRSLIYVPAQHQIADLYESFITYYATTSEPIEALTTFPLED
jgi:hypothetical protein